ncbi:MAG: methylated-DNA--[protein]-cysteine S-methyltransferase [Betaproteobacteria bacterium]
MKSIRYCTIPSPLGDMLLVAEDLALAGVYFSGQKYFPATVGDWREDAGAPVLRAAREQLGEYFAGARSTFDLPLAAPGTDFQRAVWRAIATIPCGETATYTDVAARAGRPGSVRAAGAATGRNPWSIVVPCHRVIGAGGALTGYAGGLERKRALLALEQGPARFTLAA